MKNLIIATLLLLQIVPAFSQGTVNFNNRVGGIAHVWWGNWPEIHGNSSIDTPAGTTDYTGNALIGASGLNGFFGAATTFAQLLGAPGANQAESSLMPGLFTTTFRTGANAGCVAAITEVFNNIPLDAPFATIQMVVWDNSSGLYPTWPQASLAWSNGLIGAGRSLPFTIQNVGGNINTPANIEPGLTSFNVALIPEPSVTCFALLTSVGLLLQFRKFSTRGITPRS